MIAKLNLISLFLLVLVVHINSFKVTSLNAIITPSQLVEIDEGSPLIISCKVEGANAKSAVLYRNQEKVGESRGLETTLNLKSAKPVHSGEYHCYGYSNDKVTFDHKMIKVYIKASMLVNPVSERIEKYVGENVALSCFELLESSDNIEWKRVGGSLPTKAYRSMKGQLKIDALTILDGGEYVCFTNRQEKRFKVFVTTRGLPNVPVEACQINEATCRNGQCILRDLLCNGKSDCSDGSDESACGAIAWLSRDLKKCDPTERLCQDNVCKQKIWFCDGETDCKDGSDELNCPKKKAGDLCSSSEFLCKSKNQCIKKGFVCDNTIDCQDGSDEIGCDKPQIVREPQRVIEVCAGEIITITCQAVGFPAPFINWRLNWGHICQEPRCVMSNDNGYGVLTIYDSVPTDSGAYSCEAINNLGRIFAVDALVTVKESPCGVCNCNKHSSTCNKDLECQNCQHNTYGRHCQYCLPGYRGDATRGTPNDCTKIIAELNCNPSGIIPGTPIRAESCRCKTGYTGVLCDTCDKNAYQDEYGRCISCFCNGLYDATCRPSDWFYESEKSNFHYSQHGWNVINRHLNYTSKKTKTNTKTGIFEYRGFEEEREISDKWFFQVPYYFLANRLLSYGGNLSFTIHYEGKVQEAPNDLEIRIGGVHIALQYIHPVKVYPYEEHRIVVPIVETSFRRYPDGSLVSKEHMLMALSNVDNILISASFVDTQYTTSLHDFSFDLAKTCAILQHEKVRANLVEICACPIGYNGTSCESCANGYVKSNDGQYLGLCVPTCSCNGYSNQCTNSGECLNCKNNTTGPHCEYCAPGYAGYAGYTSESGCFEVV